MWEFFGTSLISGTTILRDKGYIQKGVAKRERTFVHFIDKESNIVSSTTDIRRTMYRRNKKIEAFYQAYQKSYADNSVSIIDVYLPIETEKDSFKRFSMRLRRVFSNGEYKLLGYVWVRDIGENKFKHHYHVLIALSKVNVQGEKLPATLKFSSFWKGSRSRFVMSFYKAKEYLKCKFIPENCYNFRCYGYSR